MKKKKKEIKSSYDKLIPAANTGARDCCCMVAGVGVEVGVVGLGVPCCYHFLEARRRDRVSLRLPPRRTRCAAANADKHTDFKQLSLSLMSKVRSFILFFSLFFLRFQPSHPLTPTQILLAPPSLKCFFFPLPHSAPQPHPLHPSAPSQLNSGASASAR